MCGDSRGRGVGRNGVLYAQTRISIIIEMNIRVRCFPFICLSSSTAGFKSGLGALFNMKKHLLQIQYHSLFIDYIPVCVGLKWLDSGLYIY